MRHIYNNARLKDRRRKLRNDPTEAEKVLWRHLRNRQLGGLRFHRQYSIGRYILDFYCAESRLAIELDGGQHAEEHNERYDKERTEFLQSKNIQVLRFWNNEVLKNTEGVLEYIQNYINPS